MNKKTVLSAGVVFLLALSAMAVFASAMSTVSTTPYLDDPGGDEITWDQRFPRDSRHRKPGVNYEDPGLYEFADVAGGISSCIFDIH